MNNMILSDSGSNLVAIALWYVEEKDEKHGFTRFHFFESNDDVKKWKKRGYIFQEEFDKIQEKNKISQPGMPEKHLPDPNKVIKILNTWWSRPSWKQTNEINSICMKQIPAQDGDVKIEMDAIKYRDLKLKTCLKKWDLTDENNVEIPVTSAIIDSLVPEVAQALIFNYEQVAEPSLEQLKNSTG